ncbi:MAG: flagellin [Candidatus Caenarcaniphilales bacterium]|jgi:flagellin|nr:flagellin [Candidatus Caenarcaniphilales bacterium]
MGLVINTNTQSLFAQRALRKNTDGLKSNIERLSTGFRINRAADDAAGLSISNKLSTEIRGLEKAQQNAADGISLIQTAEGGLNVIQENLQRVRELVVQGTNGTNGANERGAIQREINERIQIISDISAATRFNGLSLLVDPNNLVLQTGAASGQTTTINLDAGNIANTGIDIDISYVVAGGSSDYGQLVESTATGFALDRLYITGANVNSYGYGTHSSNATASVADIDIIIDNVSRMRSYLGAVQNTLESKIEYIDIAKENASSSRSRIQDVDIAAESSILVKNQILQQTASSMLSQANSSPQIALQLLPRQ